MPGRGICSPLPPPTQPRPTWLQTAVAGTRMGSTGPPLLLSSGRSFGGKCSEYVLHFGSLINQQLFPAVEHMHYRAEHGGSEDECGWPEWFGTCVSEPSLPLR